MEIGMKNKYTKGDYLYMQQKKKMGILKTICLFSISAALYIAGLVTVGSNKNYLSGFRTSKSGSCH